MLLVGVFEPGQIESVVQGARNQLDYAIGCLDAAEVAPWFGVGIIHNEAAGVAAAVECSGRASGCDEFLNRPCESFIIRQCRKHSVDHLAIDIRT